MAAKNARKNKLLFILIFLLLMVNNLFSQTEKDVYFLIDKNDTLIKKQTASGSNRPEGYWIIAETRTKPLKATPIEEGKVWVPRSDDDNYIPGHFFQFFRQNDKLITEDEFNQLDIIENRKEFLNNKVPFDLSNTSYFFVEPRRCSNGYILREVFPVVFE